MQIKIGADPELFLAKSGTPVSAFGIVPGTKDAPHPVGNGAIQVDGMALEFNIDPVDEDAKTFSARIASVMDELRAAVPADLEFLPVPSVKFPEAVMKAMPPEALMLGCDPDYNAYTGELNPQPEAPERMRAAGGHVHVGWTEGADTTELAHFSSCVRLAKELDFALGLPSLFLDTDKNRRQLYGKAGAFRPKPYGMEYRSLSNFWIKEPWLREWVYDATQASVKRLLAGNDTDKRFARHACHCIDRRDLPTAMSIIHSKTLIPDKYVNAFRQNDRFDKLWREF